MHHFSLYDERKSAQAAAFLLYKAGGKLPILKLVKLMYLAERLSMRRYGDTITGDNFVSMPHGPVLSMTLEHINDAVPSAREGGWDSWIADRADYTVGLKEDVHLSSPEDDLLALSETDLECLQHTWDEFGSWDKYKLRDYTHQGGCPEWEDPNGSSRPIPKSRVLRAVGFNPEQVEALSRRLHEQQYINSAFG
ncbi:Panacea domain-containing protein [Curvibacter sp. RS43]|jgi:uncharacterized phage-associated protein|uniref:Panacea domain-containing protein n=1 Tax=Curvibacter microcysteis TaxID=3026419 RepID=UPI0023613FA2|nr:Panacea domain-containing protein [Curvibacter sp. RS43]MDD0812968.1 Panacea domain-containing protein [Curvibacter sp. RS43]